MGGGEERKRGQHRPKSQGPIRSYTLTWTSHFSASQFSSLRKRFFEEDDLDSHF